VKFALKKEEKKEFVEFLRKMKITSVESHI